MAEEKHHLFHHRKDDEGKPVDYKKEEKEHKHQDQHGEPGAAAPDTYALHEKHKEKKDPEQAHKQKIKEEVGAAVAVGGTVVAVGAGGYVLHEHHEKKEAKNGDEEANAKNHQHLF